MENLEALLFGTAGLLDKDVEDTYASDLRFRYHFLANKYQLQKPVIQAVQFFKHRPDNFPTIRLAQLAALYHSNHNLFSNLIGLSSLKEMYTILSVTTSNYWMTHL